MASRENEPRQQDFAFSVDHREFIAVDDGERAQGAVFVRRDLARHSTSTPTCSHMPCRQREIYFGFLDGTIGQST